MNFLIAIFFIYFIPVILNIILMVIFEFLCKKLDKKEDSAKDIAPLIFLPLINWVWVCILPFAVIIFSAEYFGNLLADFLDRI